MVSKGVSVSIYISTLSMKNSTEVTRALSLAVAAMIIVLPVPSCPPSRGEMISTSGPVRSSIILTFTSGAIPILNSGSLARAFMVRVSPPLPAATG